MIPLFVGSLSSYAGKNMIGLGLSLKFKDDGYRVGYFKPIGVQPTRVENVITDEDTKFFREALDLTDPMESLCPIVLTESIINKVFSGTFTDAMAKIRKAFDTVSKDKDIVLIGGVGDLDLGMAINASGAQIIEALDAKAIMVTKFLDMVFCTDRSLSTKEHLGDRLIGIVVNRATRRQSQILEDKIVPFLATRGVDMLGVIREDPLLGAVPVSELVERLNAKVLCGGGHLDALVERFSIGAMNVESALRFFQRQPNKGVIVGGDRPDIQLAALETSTRCLILTGDLYPNEIILAKAEEKEVPVLLVKSDTAMTVEECEDLTGHLSLRSMEKVRRVSEVVKESINLDLVYEKLGLDK
ncbi:MAG: phosphotransacetylase family protein [Planctomycetota bacterium]